MSKELIALVAEAIIENPPIETITDDEIILDWSPTARAAISTIRAALQEPTEEMEEKGKEQYAAYYVWRAMLAVSALGEQDE